MQTTYSPRKKKEYKKLFKAYNTVMQKRAKLKRDRLHKINVQQGYLNKDKMAGKLIGTNTTKGIKFLPNI